MKAVPGRVGLLIGLGGDTKSEEQSGMNEARMAAAKALISAVQKGDAAGVDRALEEHRMCCESDATDTDENEGDFVSGG